MDNKLMEESLEQFFQMSSQDLELQEKLKAAPDREAYIRSIVELGKEKGYSFTSDQVATALDAAESEAASSGESASELSEEQLNAVAGGGSCTNRHVTKDPGIRPKPTGNYHTRLRSCGK